MKKKPNVFMALSAAVIGIASIPVAAFVSMWVGIAMMIPCVALTYKASHTGI